MYYISYNKNFVLMLNLYKVNSKTYKLHPVNYKNAKYVFFLLLEIIKYIHKWAFIFSQGILNSYDDKFHLKEILWNYQIFCEDVNSIFVTS